MNVNKINNRGICGCCRKISIMLCMHYTCALHKWTVQPKLAIYVLLGQYLINCLVEFHASALWMKYLALRRVLCWGLHLQVQAGSKGASNSRSDVAIYTESMYVKGELWGLSTEADHPTECSSPFLLLSQTPDNPSILSLASVHIYSSPTVTLQWTVHTMNLCWIVRQVTFSWKFKFMQKGWTDEAWKYWDFGRMWKDLVEIQTILKAWRGWRGKVFIFVLTSWGHC